MSEQEVCCLTPLSCRGDASSESRGACTDLSLPHTLFVPQLVRMSLILLEWKYEPRVNPAIQETPPLKNKTKPHNNKFIFKHL